MPIIGFLNPASSDGSGDRLRGFRGLKDSGYVPLGENQFDQLPELAADLVRRRVAVIVAVTPSAALAAKSATTTIPIVFIVSEDPVSDDHIGLVLSPASPGRAAT